MSDKKGWICVHRSIQDSLIWDNDEPFDKRSAWIDLLLLANHEDREIMFDSHVKTIKRGQLLTSVRKLSEKWSWSEKRTLKFLRLLEEAQMISRNSDNRATLLTVLNYAKYQDLMAFEGKQQGVQRKHSGNTPDCTLDCTPDGTPVAQTTIYNNYNNDNNNKRRIFAPPSLIDVRDYCLERENNIDPEQFIAYYESNGWKVGKSPMKDWKAAIRNWEQRQKNDPKPKTEPKPQPRTMMHQMETRTDYDMKELERMLLGR